jgi:hypothetical protein
MRIDEYRHKTYGAELIGVPAGAQLPSSVKQSKWIRSISREAADAEAAQIAAKGYFWAKAYLGPQVLHRFAPAGWTPENDETP